MGRVHVVIQAGHSALGPIGRHPHPILVHAVHYYAYTLSCSRSHTAKSIRCRSLTAHQRLSPPATKPLPYPGQICPGQIHPGQYPIHGANCITYETGKNGVLTKVLDRVLLFIDDAKHVQLELSNS